MKRLHIFREILKNRRVLFPKWINPDSLKRSDDCPKQSPDKKYLHGGDLKNNDK